MGQNFQAQRHELVYGLRRLSIELDAVGSRFAALHGLNRTDVRAMIAIMDADHAGQPMTPGTLGAAVQLSSASVTALLDRLERAGHVRRVRDSEDRRRVGLELTESALAASEAFFGGLHRELVATLSTYSPAELEVIRRFLAQSTAAVVDHQAPDQG